MHPSLLTQCTCYKEDDAHGNLLLPEPRCQLLVLSVHVQTSGDAGPLWTEEHSRNANASHRTSTYWQSGVVARTSG